MLEDPSQGTGANHEKMDATTQGSGQDSKPEGLQKQICDLAAELTKQASWWFTAHKNLQSQIDALTKENQELREDMKALKQNMKAKKTPTDLSPPAKPSNTMPVYIRIEGIDSEKTTSWEDERDDAPSGSPQNGSTMATGGTDSLEDRVSFMSFGEKNLLPKSVPREVSHSLNAKTDKETKEKRHPSGKVEEVLSDGRTIITFPNGTRKEISADKKTTLIKFFNGDMKKVKPDQRVIRLKVTTQGELPPNVVSWSPQIYYYADAQTTHTTYPDGVEVVQFPNKWTEKFYPDGSKETVFPDGTVKQLRDGCEETVFPDGTAVTVQRNGDKIIVFSNGQKEIHTATFKRREFPDGTTKTIYCNGCQETKYASGRVRVKDEMGTVILDWK